jgi:cobalamin-dependent methionine synthase I
MIFHYDIPDVAPYINWHYFFFAWQLKEKEEQLRIRREADLFLAQITGKYHTHALFLLLDAYSDGDDIIVMRGKGQSAGCERIPCLRQQQVGSDFLCLSDFIAPENVTSLTSHPSPFTSQIGIFATSADIGLETDFNSDPYMKMMAQLVADRLAEATAECLHEAVRKQYWGYAPDEHLTMDELHQECFVGIRPAVGYPSLPDASLNFLLDRILNMGQIGIRLTENGAMRPHASVSGLMMAHPRAHYFSIGKVGDDQLNDYALRRGIPVGVVRKFIVHS